MFKKSLLAVFVTSLLVLTGCFGKTIGENYILYEYKDDPDYNVVEMQTFDSGSQFFTFMYKTEDWKLEEWSEWDAPNVVAIVHKDFDSEDASTRCAILPGTIGTGPIDGGKILEGALLTENYNARTLDIYDAEGNWVRHVVGYEVDDYPYIFEVQLPAEDSEKSCLIASQEVVGTFVVEQEEEVKTILNEVVEDAEGDAEAEVEADIEEEVTEEVSDTSEEISEEA